MRITRRNFIRGAGTSFAIGGLMSSTALTSVLASTGQAATQRVFHATHYGAFQALVDEGKLVGVEPIPHIDARPTVMLTEGVVDRTYHRTRVKYPMVRKSWLENWNKPGQRKPERRNKEPFVRVDWDTAIKLVVKESLDIIENDGNEAIFNSSYGGWSHTGLMRPNVLQGRLFNLLGGTTITVGDWSGGTYSNNKIYAKKKVIEPVGESLDDFEIFRRMAEEMGLEGQFTETKEYDELLQFAYEMAAISKKVPFEEFWERGWVEMDMPKEARKWVRHGDFRDDPEKHPLHTESGKVEMFCKTIADMKIDDCPGIPKYLGVHEFLGNAKKGQVHVVSPHPYYRLHSQMANADRVRARHAIKDREPCLINSDDAKERGIKDGDLMEVYNDRGAIIVGAVVTDNIMKGVISIYEGCWPSVDSKGRCNSGLVNFLTSTQRSSGLSQATSANTCLASVKKCTDPDGPNQAYDPPAILDKVALNLDDDTVNADRGSELLGAFLAEMEPGEKMFYERCTVCHGPREPKNFTQNQWKGITKTMFERAGLETDERKLVLDFLMKAAKDAPAL